MTQIIKLQDTSRWPRQGGNARWHPAAGPWAQPLTLPRGVDLRGPFTELNNYLFSNLCPEVLLVKSMVLRNLARDMGLPREQEYVIMKNPLPTEASLNKVASFFSMSHASGSCFLLTDTWRGNRHELGGVENIARVIEMMQQRYRS